MDIGAFIEKWRDSAASERANKDSFLHDLCDVLAVAHPDPKTGDPDRDRYVFEREAVLVHGGDKHSIGFIDLYKYSCFILEAKQGSEIDSKKMGTARRGTAAWNMAMNAAYGQAFQYASTMEPAPPFLIVTDIGYCFDLYASFDGSRRYQKFPDALRSRINIEGLREPQNIGTLRTIFTDPHSLDPSKRSARVTREIAGHLANLAKSLEESAHDPELVAKFLMRCLFTMFAEDVELLPKGIFADALKNRWIEHPEAFPGEVQDLWRQMNEGGYLFGAGKIWRFNGGLFADPIALPLTKHQLIVLGLAAAMNWSDVEPAIFGTLLERALNPKERQRLGAHYTPRAYVERLVRPTIEEPLREEWDNVRAQVMTLLADVDPEKNMKAVGEARKIVHAFYDRLTHIRVLDPACGSGNFLFVALDLFKRIENEVIELLDSLGDDRAIVTFGRMVTPQQFLGIEIKPWAKEITELVLWIGWLQWQIRTKGWRSHPDEPILRDYHNIECRDAVLSYDRRESLLGEDRQPVTQWDGDTTKISSVTGEEVPDDSARVPVYRYVNPRKADWPRADFIVGNPPFIGTKRMKQALGEGYVESIRRTYADVMQDNADFVMFWWHKAAELVRSGQVARFGFITTNSITQAFNRRVVNDQINAPAAPLTLVFAIPDHPWVDSSDGAAVRVAMTVGSSNQTTGSRLLLVTAERPDPTIDDTIVPEFVRQTGRINSDLTTGAAVASAVSLKANDGIATNGIALHGQGFVLDPLEADVMRASGPLVIKQFLGGRDLLSEPRERYVIDFSFMELEQARNSNPAAFQHVVDHVKPERDQNKRSSIRERWWRFAWERPVLMEALAGLRRFIATTETAKHRVFQFVQSDVRPDHMIIAIALDDAYHLGILSSRAHITWTLASGGTLEDRPRYNKSVCFDTFPFPDASEPTKKRIHELGEQLDSHRKRQQATYADLSVTSIYNVLEKLRTGESLTAKEKIVHEQGLVSVLKQLHDELDAAVLAAYGWQEHLRSEQILEGLVALNADRAAEEKRGIVRWLRPDYQNPSGVAAPTQVRIAIGGEEGKGPGTVEQAARAWPKELPQRIAAVRDVVSSGDPTQDWTSVDVAKAFTGARKKDVEPVLESLAAVGLLVSFSSGSTACWRSAL